MYRTYWTRTVSSRSEFRFSQIPIYGACNVIIRMASGIWVLQAILNTKDSEQLILFKRGWQLDLIYNGITRGVSVWIDLKKNQLRAVKMSFRWLYMVEFASTASTLFENRDLTSRGCDKVQTGAYLVLLLLFPRNSDNLSVKKKGWPQLSWKDMASTLTEQTRENAPAIEVFGVGLGRTGVK